MDRIGRYVKFRAAAGNGDALAAKLTATAEAMHGVAGCELYLVNRAVADPDDIWVTEQWRSRADADAALKVEGAEAEIEAVMALLDRAPELIEVTPVGGVGPVDARDAPAHTVVALEEVDDSAEPGGFGEMGEARFANDALETRATGVSLHRLKPGRRQPFGHRHDRAEEVYVVLAGSGRAKLDDEVVDLQRRDAVRVAPGVARAFEAGPDGLELLACGPRHRGDSEILMGWWSD
jgi:quinol monooxygenase YgiN/mannose-6-phosphate isomerase-like protein (cupin superfamily)